MRSWEFDHEVDKNGFKGFFSGLFHMKSNLISQTTCGFVQALRKSGRFRRRVATQRRLIFTCINFVHDSTSSPTTTSTSRALLLGRFVQAKHFAADI